MGCTTSKESVQPAAEDNKEDVKNGDIPKSAVSGESTAEAGTPAEVKSSPSSGKERDIEAATEANDDDKDKEVEAATRIQAAFRGHHARKSMKEMEGSTQQQGAKTGDNESTQEHDGLRAYEKELTSAASKIGASLTGHMSRKDQACASVGKAVGDFVDNASAKVGEKMDDVLNELDGIDLTDPDLHKAATKIQASFRGHKVRQEVVPGMEEKK